jgi:hypothetical protein
VRKRLRTAQREGYAERFLRARKTTTTAAAAAAAAIKMTFAIHPVYWQIVPVAAAQTVKTSGVSRIEKPLGEENVRDFNRLVMMGIDQRH